MRNHASYGFVVLILLGLTGSPSLLQAADFSGPVLRILDGDTIEVLHEDRSERIRLHGIDCPERGQAFVWLLDGTNINNQLVKDGWCWWYWKYAIGDVELEKFEKEARESKKGLWVDPAPVPPWEWRRR
jgi:endonuclease YncB( thermonuclease family)